MIVRKSQMWQNITFVNTRLAVLSQKCTFGTSAPSTFKTVWLRNSVLHAHTHCK